MNSSTANPPPQGRFIDSITITTAATLATTLIFTYFISSIYQLGPWAKFKNLPPGPPSGLITGTPNFSIDKPHIWWNKLAKTYGPILTVWRGQTPFIVLSSPEDITELLQRRGTSYSSRPKMHVFHDILFKSLFIPSCDHNDIWRRQRKIITTLIGIRAVKELAPTQYYESEQMMNDIVDSPDKFFNHAERFGSSILTATVYGYRSHDLSHPSARSLMLIGGWIEHKLSPTRYVDDAWPIIQRVPKMLAFWRKQYYKDAAVVSAMAKAWWEPCKARVRAGILTPCFATSFVQRYEAEGWSDEDAALVTFGLMLAGAGTTGGTVNFFIMACCKFPETMRKAQEEIDRVVGNKRYPTLEDEANLPYVRAMIKENHRWRPISNHGVPHATTKEDWYKGYRIPKGATVVANAYAIHQNESKHPNPNIFDPERYINYSLSAVDAANLRDAEERDHWAYGAGRRICAGIHVAEVSLFIVCSRLLWGFNMSLSKDAAGNDIPIDDMRYNGDMFGKPHQFQATITPRSPERAAFMKKTFANATTTTLSLKEASESGTLGNMDHLVKILEEDPETTAEH